MAQGRATTSGYRYPVTSYDEEKESIEMTSAILSGAIGALGPATEVSRGDPPRPHDGTPAVQSRDTLAQTLRMQQEKQQAPAASPSESEVRSAVKDLNATVQNSQRAIQFSVDDESGNVIIKVIDAETDEIIRQIPPEEVVRLAKRMEESVGSLLHTEV